MAGRRTGGLGKGLDALIPNKAGGPSKEPAKKTRSAAGRNRSASQCPTGNSLPETDSRISEYLVRSR